VTGVSKCPNPFLNGQVAIFWLETVAKTRICSEMETQRGADWRDQLEFLIWFRCSQEISTYFLVGFCVTITQTRWMGRRNEGNIQAKAIAANAICVPFRSLVVYCTTVRAVCSLQCSLPLLWGRCTRTHSRTGTHIRIEHTAVWLCGWMGSKGGGWWVVVCGWQAIGGGKEGCPPVTVCVCCIWGMSQGCRASF